MHTDETIDVTLAGRTADLAARGRWWLFIILVVAPGAGALPAAILFAH